MLKANRFKSKRGVSPLIATSLLIAFAVALGSVVMNWSLNLGSDNKSQDGCRNVEIKVRNVNSAEICFGTSSRNGYINFIIDNTGSVDIKGLVMWIIGGKSTKLIDLDNAFIKHGTLYKKNDKEVNYDLSLIGNLRQVQFIPKVQIGQATEICPKNGVKADKIEVCG